LRAVRPLAVIGPLSRAVVAGSEPRIGGGAWHAGRALAALKADATIVTACGTEDESWFRTELDALGLPYELHAGGATTAFSFSYDDAGARTMAVDATGQPFAPWVDAEWVHVAPLLRGDTVVPRAPHVLLDGQGLVRRPQLGPLRLDADVDPELLRGVSILKLAEEEAAVLGPVDVPELIVTHGIRGATVNGTHIPAEPVDADPTGAGDMFAAGYLAARASGAEPVEAGRSASALVSSLLSDNLSLGRLRP
jgi:sugar/nucleoside kinase (ribokinase family)